MYHYIYQNQFVTSDEELSSDNYPIGQDISDYMQGKYVPLNAQQIEYEEQHPNASPEEVFEMQPQIHTIHVTTPQDLMSEYFDREHNLVYINDEVHPCWNNQDILYTAQLAKKHGRTEFIFRAEDKYFKGNIDTIIDMMEQIALYYYDFGMTVDLHYRYLEKHPEEIGNYDYTTGFPEVLHFNLEEVYDID